MAIGACPFCQALYEGVEEAVSSPEELDRACTSCFKARITPCDDCGRWVRHENIIYRLTRLPRGSAQGELRAPGEVLRLCPACKRKAGSSEGAPRRWPRDAL